jgi:signal transduction histidine kinase
MLPPTAALCVLIALCFVGNLAAEFPRARFLTRWWQSEEGLPGNVLRSVVQARDGFLWVGTAEGVVRFDGVRFTGFALEPDATFARQPVRSLFALEDGSVWIANSNGALLRWDGSRVRCIVGAPEALPTGAAVVPFHQVCMDPKGATLLVRGSELSMWSRESAPKVITRSAELDNILARDLQRARERGRILEQHAMPQLRDYSGRTWHGRPDGGLTVSVPTARDEIEEIPVLNQENFVAELCEDREGSIWVATRDAGLFQVREARAGVFSVAEGLSDRTALALMEDRSGAFWVASKRGGVDQIIDGKVTHYDVGDSAPIRSVSALWQDSHGVLWAATRDGSVFRWINGVFKNATGSALPISKVIAITDDGRGTVWFGGTGILGSISNGKFARYGPESGFTSSDVSALAMEGDRLWVGGRDGSVYEGIGGRFRRLRATNPVARPVSGLLPEGEGGLWSTVLGGGLIHWHGNNQYVFGTAAGLPDARLTTVIADSSGFLWLGSLAGIFRVSKAELLAHKQDTKNPVTWVVFDRSDGLLSRECTGNSHPASWRGRDGTLYFPTVNGVAFLAPERLARNDVSPPIVIEEVRIGGKSFDPGASLLSGGPGRSRLEIRYTALSLAAPEKVRFQAQLAGLESTWQDTDGRRSVSYESVPPGKYRFMVKAANGDGVWSEGAAAVDLQVRPHFWETSWFRFTLISLAALAALTTGWLLARARMKRRMARLELQRATEAERARIAQDLHDDLGASLTEISMLASIAAEENATGEPSPEALPEIAGKAQALVGALDEIVWAVNPRNDTLASLAEYFAGYAVDFLDKCGMSVRLDIPRGLPHVPLPPERRHGLFLSVREALNNVAKHSDAREVWLRLRQDHGYVEVAIEDDGIGIDAARIPHGEGLRNMRQRMIALGGECLIEPREGGGTRACFRMPLQSEIRRATSPIPFLT